MATTEQKRKWYPEHVTNHADRGKAGYKPRCDWSDAALIAVPNDLGGVYVEPVHPKTWQAWDAYVFLMRHLDQSITVAGGVNSCRNIGTSVWPSLHAYLLALDNPPNGRKSAEFQSAVLRIRTNSGARVFKNLASADDRMHDEIDCSPADLATGIDWSTVEGHEMPLSDEEIAKVAKATASAVWNAPVKRGRDIDGNLTPDGIAAIQELADAKTLLLRQASFDPVDEEAIVAQILEGLGEDQARIIANKLIQILAD